jgi:hypothetical protein
MNKLFVSFLFTLMFFGQLQAQKKDSIPQQDDLLSSLTSDTTHPQKLLPDHIMFTQRLLWGKKGLMRNFSAFELTPAKRDRELKIRRTMLISHQALGTLTSLGMIGQGIVGAKLYNGDRSVKDLHEALAVGVNIGYFTTASLALFAPPKMLDERKGFSSIKVHKWLAILHMSCMIATNVLADQLEGHPELRKWHRAAAYTAFGAFFVAEGVIKF